MQSSALPLGHAAVLESIKAQNDFNNKNSNTLLVICNGHGEDVIALEIIKKLLLNNNINIEILPLVGNGKIFDSILSDRVKKIGVQQDLPTGGFSNQSFMGLILDLKAGMISILLKNFLEVRAKANSYKLLAIGDLVPLFFAWSSNCNFGFIGTPKSDYTWINASRRSLVNYYHKLKGTEWEPWEIYLMKSSRCKFVLMRDLITSNNLKQKQINSCFLGNPMMDFVKDQNMKLDTNKKNKLLLLIGSRFPEAINNLNSFLQCLDNKRLTEDLIILMPLSINAKIKSIKNNLKSNKFRQDLKKNFYIGEESIWMKNNLCIVCGKNTFHNWAYLSDVGLANAGTATEQISGLGIPSLSLPGKGPQFTRSFAMRQQRLLGGSVDVCYDQTDLVDKLLLLLGNKEYRLNKAKIGMERMGKSGASQKIAEHVNLKLLTK